MVKPTRHIVNRTVPLWKPSHSRVWYKKNDDDKLGEDKEWKEYVEYSKEKAKTRKADKKLGVGAGYMNADGRTAR